MATQVPKNGDFSQLLGSGENPRGFVSQTANGTLVNGHGGDGWDHPMVMADGERWNTDPRPGIPHMPDMPMPVRGGSSGAAPDGAFDVGATLPRRVKRK